MPKYRKKPIDVEAFQWDGSDHPLVCHNPACGNWTDQGHCPHIHTLEGNMVLSPGDYIITGIRGEHYPVRRDIFEDSYVLVEDGAS